eukprot:336456_1
MHWHHTVATPTNSKPDAIKRTPIKHHIMVPINSTCLQTNGLMSILLIISLAMLSVAAGSLAMVEVTLGPASNAKSTNTPTITLWSFDYVYEFPLDTGGDQKIYYIYESETSNLGTSYCAPKVMIENNDDNGIILDKIRFQLDNGMWYGIDGFDPLVWDDLWCIDNEDPSQNDGCGPSAQIVYFDTRYPNTYVGNAWWEDATVQSNDELYCLLSTPQPTNKPTPNPTKRPTPYPTKKPSPNPTAHPTPNPSVRPTSNPSLRPTPNPTVRPTLNPTAKPTPNPTQKPTNKPTPLPTPAPTLTVKPTSNPTNATPTGKPTPKPTLQPTSSPQQTPSVFPTEMPSRLPSGPPTYVPSESPTNKPTKRPTTLPPTTPGSIFCGDQDVVGEYNGQVLEFTVVMMHPGDMSFDMSYSTFIVTAIEAYDNDNTLLDTDYDGNQAIYLSDKPEGSYKFKILGTQQTGLQYDVRTRCTTASPTPAPSEPPTNPPSVNPTEPPTKNRVIATDHPTQSPTARPSTVPTRPGDLTCGSHVSGAYNGVSVMFTLHVSYESDVTFDASQSTFTVESISVINTEGAVIPTLTQYGALSAFTMFNVVVGTYSFSMGGAAANGAYDITITCESNAPTLLPTSQPIIPTFPAQRTTSFAQGATTLELTNEVENEQGDDSIHALQDEINVMIGILVGGSVMILVGIVICLFVWMKQKQKGNMTVVNISMSPSHKQMNQNQYIVNSKSIVTLTVDNRIEMRQKPQHIVRKASLSDHLRVTAEGSMPQGDTTETMANVPTGDFIVEEDATVGKEPEVIRVTTGGNVNEQEQIVYGDDGYDVDYIQDEDD